MVSNEQVNQGVAPTQPAPSGQSAQPAERGLPGVHGQRRRNRVRKVWVLLVIVLGVLVAAAGVAVFLKRLEVQMHERKEAERKAPQNAPADVGHDFAAEKARIEQEKATLATPSGAAQAGASAAAAAGMTTGLGNGVTNYGTGTTDAQQDEPDARLQGEVLIDLKHGSRASSSRDSSPARQADAGAPGNPSAGAGSDSLDGRLSPSTLASVKAGRLPDLTYLLKRGTIIPCGTRTRIVSTYPGMTSCIVSKDVYSANGKTLLIRAGSEVSGEQRSALMQGQARIFVLWSRVDMPDGAYAQLDSPGTDALGGNGHEAWVDTHFWDRFGGAIMLSLVSDVGQALTNLTQKSGTSSISLSGTSSAVQSVMAETLKNTINIPPTAYSNQGSAINIFVARDVDFRSVYELAGE